MHGFGAVVFFMLILFGMGTAWASTVPGAISGSFGVSETGAATYSIPIAVPPGTAGMEPKLMLGYSSQSGEGIAGTGWSVSGLSAIARCSSTIAQDGITRGVQYDAKDKFCLDGQRLIAVKGTYGADGTEYRTEIESFTRVISHGTTTTGPQWFEAWTKSGQHIEYGNAATSATSNVTVAPLTTGGVTPTIVWTVDKISDTVGNYITFTYLDDPSNGQSYPQEIDYTGNAASGLSPYNKVTFSYGPRASNPPAVYLNGYKSQLTQRLTTITTWAGATQARTYSLGYSSSGDFMDSVQECDGARNCVNPTTFAWQLPSGSGDFESTQPTISGTDFTTAWFASSGDVNGDGYDDLLTIVNGGDGQSHLLLRTAMGGANVFNAPVDVGITTPLRDCSVVANCYEQQMWSGLSAPAEVSILGDVNGDGQADLILGDGRVVLGQTNGTFGTPYAANVQIGAASTAAAKNINGDSYADILYSVVQSDNLTHYYAQYAIPQSQPGGSVTYANPIQVATAPLVPRTTIPTYRGPTYDAPCTATLGDVNGDGRADIVTCTGHVYLAADNYSFTDAGVWGSVGYSNCPSYLPDFLSAADFNGDGLSDVLTGTMATFNCLKFSNLLTDDTNKSDGHAFGISTLQGEWGGFYSGAQLGVPFYGVVAGSFTGRGQADALEFNYAGASSGQPHPTATLLLAHVNNSPVITSTTDGLGASRSITYSQLNNSAVYTASTGSVYPMRDLPPTTSSLYLVSSTSADNGINGHFILNYQYVGAKSHLLGGGFLGFRQVTVHDPQAHIRSTTIYRQDYPYQGQPLSTQKLTDSGVLLGQSLITYTDQLLNTGISPTWHQSLPTHTVESSYELTGGLISTVVTDTQYDAWGNPTAIAVDSGGGYNKTTTNTYDNIIDANRWFLGRLRRSAVTSVTP